MKNVPDILTFSDGRKVNADNWQDRRAELIDILSREEYGYMPKVYGKTTYTTSPNPNNNCSGHADITKYEVTVPTEKGDFTYPMNLTVPNAPGKYPLFVIMNFTPHLYEKYIPLEEITDNGFAVAHVYYKDVSSDDEDMSDGLSGMYSRPGDGTGYGKISIWAFAISRALDCLEDRDDIDFDNVAVIGHSRLGKTALWCGANDERFKYVISSCSGCGGAAFERTKNEGAETIEFMNHRFPYWFCENRQKYAASMDNAPFDQHYLLAASAPRNVLVGSATMDLWADPASELQSCREASPAFELFGEGFIGPDGDAVVDEAYSEGKVSYHLRDGTHYLGRKDWHIYMDYINRNK